MKAIYRATVTRPPPAGTEADVEQIVVGKVEASVVDSLPGAAWRAARKVMKRRLAPMYAWKHLRIDLWRTD